MRASVTNQEATDYLRELVKGPWREAYPQLNVGTHSLKATALSWCAKFGIALSVRRQLGYHVQADDKSALTYSRDAAALPLRELDRVLTAIRAGGFDPDSTRSGRFVPRPSAAPAPPEARAREARSRSPATRDPSPAYSWSVVRGQGFPGESEAASDVGTSPVLRPRPSPGGAGAVGGGEELPSPTRSKESEGSESDSSGSSSAQSAPEVGVDGQAEAEELAGALDAAQGRRPASGASRVLVRHAVTGCHHLEREDDPSRLACGRPRHGGHRGPTGTAVVTFLWPRCGQCFGTSTGSL